MSENYETTTNESIGNELSTSRRQFLQATGMAAIAAGTGAGAAMAAPESSSSLTPGAIDEETLSEYIENPATFEENHELPHVTATVPFESTGQAIDSDVRYERLEDRFDHSPYFRLLDGDWKFRRYENYAAVPDSHDGIDWDSIAVPSSWQTQGFGQRIYSNIDLTWNHYDPPSDANPVEEVPLENNPVGVYRRSFEVPDDWDGRETFLHFAGVKQAYFVWIDGQYLGYHQGSMTPGEFDVTDHVTPGEEHQVTLQVYRFSDGEAVEDQDMFRYSGIFRSVSLYSTPAVHVRDFFVRSDLDDDYEDATLRVDAELANYGEETGEYEVRGRLYEPNGDGPHRGPPEELPGRGPPDNPPGRGPPAGVAGGSPSEEGTGRGPPDGRGSIGSAVASLSGSVSVDTNGAHLLLETEVSDPEKWSAEDPTLYTLVLELVPGDGNEERDDNGSTEVLLEKVGFREYEAERGELSSAWRVNGEPMNVRGVNRHETDPDSGRHVPIETLRTDFETMKRFNVNSVRTSHYPNDPSFYRLADEYGIYVQDEVNVETHWWEQMAANVDAFDEQMLARWRRMVQRDKNHASVFVYSTGNEAGTGPPHIAMAAYVLGEENADRIPDTFEARHLSGADDAERVGEDLSDLDAEGTDPTRQLYHQPNGGGWTIEYSDMLGPRYPMPDGLLSEGDGTGLGDGERPVMMGEYNHAMGNSLGLIHDMWSNYIQPPVRRARDGAGDNDGVLVGDPAVVGDGQVAFDGEGDHIEVLDAEGLAFSEPGFTVEVTAREIGDDVPLIAGDGYALGVSGGEIEFSVGDVSVTALASGGDDWHTLAGVCADEELQLYVDDEQVAAEGHSIEELDASDEAYIAGDPDEGQYASATLDSVSVYAETPGGDSYFSPDGAVLSYDFSGLARDKSLQGGWIWDWVNQDLNDETDDGVPFQFYDLDGPDAEFCLNGTVWSDRRPQPEMWQLKKSHQPVGIAPRDVENGEIYVTNHFGFTDMDELETRWELVADDEPLQSGELDLDMPPGETRYVTVPFEKPDLEPDVEYWLDVSVCLAEPTDYADAGYEVAFEQFAVPFDVPDSGEEDIEGMPAVSITESENSVAVAGEDFRYTFDTELGTFASMEYRGTELLDRGPLLNAWRAPIMNEKQDWGGTQSPDWYEAGLDDLQHVVESVETDQPDDSIMRIDVEGFAEGGGGEGEALITPDASSTGADGVLRGDPEIVEGPSGNAVALDGEDDYVEVGTPDALDFTEPGFTVEVTFSGVDDATHGPLVAKGDYQYAMKTSDGESFEFFVYDDGWVTLQAPIPDDARDGWHTLAGVCTDEELQLYLDGEQLAAESHSVSEIDRSDSPVRIGQNADQDRYTETTVDSVAVYDGALGGDDLSEGFDEPPENAVLWYDLDEFEESEDDSYGPGFATRYTYRIFGTGEVVLDVESDPNDQLRSAVSDWLPKVGVQLELPETFDEFEWYGRGPQETMPDRKWGVRIGRYEGSVDDQYVPYLPPQDNGNKADTRWAAVSNDDVGIAAFGHPDMHASLEGYANLDEADHQYELEERGSIGFNLDHAVTGVGGTPTTPLPEYQVQPEPMNFTFTFRPFADEDPMELANRSLPATDDA